MGVLAAIFGFVEPNQAQQITPDLLKLVRTLVRRLNGEQSARARHGICRRGHSSACFPPDAKAGSTPSRTAADRPERHSQPLRLERPLRPRKQPCPINGFRRTPPRPEVRDPLRCNRTLADLCLTPGTGCPASWLDGAIFPSKHWRSCRQGFSSLARSFVCMSVHMECAGAHVSA